MHRWHTAVAALGTSAAIILTTAPAAGAHPAAPKPYTTLCVPYSHLSVHGPRGRMTYVVRDDDIARIPFCLSNYDHGPNFTVTRSAADTSGPENQAFPEILFGCAWHLCSTGSFLPREVRHLGRPVTSIRLHLTRTGVWNAAYDIWIAKARRTGGQDHGAEIMIWLATSGFGRPSAPVVRIDGASWWLGHRVVCHGILGCWNYIVFRRTTPAASARLWLAPFLARAQRIRQVSRRWYLTSVDFGFEIWRGGRGLAVTSYAVRG